MNSVPCCPLAALSPPSDTLRQGGCFQHRPASPSRILPLSTSHHPPLLHNLESFSASRTLQQKHKGRQAGRQRGKSAAHCTLKLRGAAELRVRGVTHVSLNVQTTCSAISINITQVQLRVPSRPLTLKSNWSKGSQENKIKH